MYCLDPISPTARSLSYRAEEDKAKTKTVSGPELKVRSAGHDGQRLGSNFQTLRLPEK
jgi:hypothetical protein